MQKQNNDIEKLFNSKIELVIALYEITRTKHLYRNNITLSSAQLSLKCTAL